MDDNQFDKCRCGAVAKWDEKKKRFICSVCLSEWEKQHSKGDPVNKQGRPKKKEKIMGRPKGSKNKKLTEGKATVKKKVSKKAFQIIKKSKGELHTGCELCAYKKTCKFFGQIPSEICKYYKEVK